MMMVVMVMAGLPALPGPRNNRRLAGLGRRLKLINQLIQLVGQ